MISLTTLTLLICSVAIVVFFAQEFLDALKKIFQFPGVKLFVPLILVSSLIARYELWERWLLFRINMILNHFQVESGCGFASLCANKKHSPSQRTT